MRSVLHASSSRPAGVPAGRLWPDLARRIAASESRLYAVYQPHGRWRWQVAARFAATDGDAAVAAVLAAMRSAPLLQTLEPGRDLRWYGPSRVAFRKRSDWLLFRLSVGLV